MKRFLISVLFLTALSCSYLRAQTDTVYISNLYTTHLVFTTDLTYADLSNTQIVVAKVIEQNKNMLAIKARQPFTATASLTALESNGDIHTYILAYREHPERLIYDAREESQRGLGESGGNTSTAEGAGSTAKEKSGKPDAKPRKVKSAGSTQGNVSLLRQEDAPSLEAVYALPQRLHHLATRSGRIEFVCESIFSYSDITYITLSLRNRSGVSYETGDATFVVESRNKGKRKVVYEQNIFPKNRYGTLTTASRGKSRITYSLEKLTLAPDQVINIYLYENSGRRNLILTLTPDDINLAKNPFE